LKGRSVRHRAPTEDNKAARIMRRAILLELLHPSGPDEPLPVDKLQAVARTPVDKAAGGKPSERKR
jgi:hypothetical protein